MSLVDFAFRFGIIATNVLGLGEVGGLEVQMFKLALMLIEVQKFNLALMPPFCQTPVGGSFISTLFLLVH